METNKNQSNIKLYKYATYILLAVVIVFIFVLIRACSNACFISEGALTLEEIQKMHPLIDPAQSLYDKQDLVINLTPLRNRLEALGRENPDLTIYFEALNSGANISINNNLEIWPASLMKIPVAMAVMKRVEKGKWKLSNELLMLAGDKDKGYGDLYKEPTGKAFTIDFLLKALLVDSDNTARSIFMRNLDPEEIQSVLDHLGLEDIFGTEQGVRAKKYSIFWRSLYTSSFLSAPNSEKIIDLMTHSAAREYLQRGLPDGVSFSHKIGWTDEVAADSGIVYVPKRPYILTVMTRRYNPGEAGKLMEQISKEVYEYVANY